MEKYSLADYDSEVLEIARAKVADDWRKIAHSIRKENGYAAHVTEDQKDKNLQKSLVYADEIAKGKHDHNFTILQRLIIELTGDCPALLP